MLRGVDEDYVINDAALAYMREHGLDRQAIAKLAVHPNKTFPSQIAWLEHLAALKIDIFDRDLAPTASEAALRGSIRSHNLLDGAVVVSDDAGQFRIGVQALCWVHAERLVHKLMPTTRRQEQSVKAIRDQIWRFYRALKAWKDEPSAHLKRSFETTFTSIFSQTTGYEALDQLLRRLRRRKAELLRVLEHPKIPLHTNASENDIRTCVTKRKISGGAMSRQSRFRFFRADEDLHEAGHLLLRLCRRSPRPEQRMPAHSAARRARRRPGLISKSFRSASSPGNLPHLPGGTEWCATLKLG